MKSTDLCLCSLVLTAILHAPALADQDSEETSDSRFGGLTIGFGVGYEQSPYRDLDENETEVLPLISYERGGFYFSGTTLGYNLFESEDGDSEIYLDLIGEIDPGGYKASDSPYFAGMEDRDDMAFSVGFETGMFTPFGLVELSIAQDVAGAHDGFFADLSYAVPFGDEEAGYEISPYIGATYYSDDYNDYYYGVRSNEATAARPAYQADGGVNPYAGIEVLYLIGHQWLMFGDLSYEILDSNVEDSPLIDRDHETSVKIGIAYSFR